MGSDIDELVQLQYFIQTGGNTLTVPEDYYLLQDNLYRATALIDGDICRIFDMKLLPDEELYLSTDTCIKYLKKIPQSLPTAVFQEQPLIFHCYWSGKFGAKQALSIKSFLATQDLHRAQLWLWLDKNNGYDGYENNCHLKPLLSRITVKSYDFFQEAADTPLVSSELLEIKHQVRLSNVFRMTVLYKYGGCYFDLDIMFLRNFLELLNITESREFCYRWSGRPFANSAILKLDKQSKTSHYLIEKAIRKRKCRPMDLFPIADEKLELLMLPAVFFDPLWLLVDKMDKQSHYPFKSFKEFFRGIDMEQLDRQIPKIQEFINPCFTYHWHNQWNTSEIPNSIAGYFNRQFDLKLTKKYGLYPFKSFT
jgi:Glycosyltransferase sugar-binding region containing DXD motif